MSAWNNGQWHRSGAGYGVRVGKPNRDRHFQPSWPVVRVLVGTAQATDVAIAASFWRECPGLRSATIGRWLIGLGLGRWPRGAPPTLRLDPVGDRTFQLRLPD